MIRPIGDDVLCNSYTVIPVYKDTEGAIESVRIKRVEFREDIRVFFPQGHSKLSVIMTEVSVMRGLTPVLVCTCSSLFVATEL